MEPADPVQEAQGLHLRQQASKIVALSRGMEALNTRFTQVSEAHTHTPLPAPASPPRPVLRPISEPCLPAPERYDGDLGQCRPFLSTCSVFEVQPSSFPLERSKVTYVITLLSGREWGTTMWDADIPECQCLPAPLEGSFYRLAASPTATWQLFRIRQGSWSISDYAIEVRTLAVSAGWGEKELHVAFYNRLGESLLDELSMCDLPPSLDGLVDLSLRIDACLAERRTTHRFRSTDDASLSRRSRRLPHSQTPDLPNPEPMQLGRIKLSKAERQQHRDQHLCMYCGGAGHIRFSCPLKATAHQ